MKLGRIVGTVVSTRKDEKIEGLKLYLVRDVSLSLGVVLLWLDFFITMAIFRRTVRDIDGRLKRIEERLTGR